MIICYCYLRVHYSNAMIRKRVIERMRKRVDIIPSCVYDGYIMYLTVLYYIEL